MRRLAGFTLVVIGLAMPLAAHAQELRTCTPLAPGLRCARPLPGPWGNVDFGAPKPSVQFVLDASRGLEVTPLMAHAHGHVPIWEARRTPEPAKQAGCTTSPVAAVHSAHSWFVPTLPPLPAVQPLLPIAHGHRLAPALPVAPAAPCK